MMTGIVNDVLEVTLCLQILSQTRDTIESVVIDTGYNGALTLPLAVIPDLALSPLASRSVTLGDRSCRVLDFYEAEVKWNSDRQTIPVLCVEGDPLIGTALLDGFKMEVDFVIGGRVRVMALR